MNDYLRRREPQYAVLSLRGLRHHLTTWRGSEAAPVFLLHGWMDTGESFQFLADAMSDHWTLVAPDWRGFGRSEWPADGYWFPDYYADLDALLTTLSPDTPATLVGHSMGGNVALAYAGIRPERVRRVVCIEGFGLPRTRPDQAPGRYREWLRQLREPAAFAEYPSFEAFAHLLARRNPRLTAERAAFIARAWACRGEDGVVRVRSDPAHKRVNPVLYRREEAEACWRELAAPVLYVLGAESEFTGRLGGEADPAHMASLIRRLEPCVVPDAGHMVHHERPDLLARAIESFLART